VAHVVPVWYLLGARVCYKKQLTPIQLCDYSLFLVWLIINIFKWLYDFLCVILPFAVQLLGILCLYLIGQVSYSCQLRHLL